LDYYYAGRADEARPLFVAAREEIEEALATASPADRPPLELALGSALVGLGRPDAAVDRVQAALRELHLGPQMLAPDLRVEAIRVLASARAVDLVVAELGGYLESGYGRWSLEGILPHPAFDAIRDDPRFLDLVH